MDPAEPSTGQDAPDPPARAAPALCILGAPSPLTSWVFDLARTLLAERGRQATVVNRGDAPTAEWGGGVVLAQYPSRALLEILADGNGACVLVLDDPHDMVAFATAGRPDLLDHALRAVSASLSCLASVRRAQPGAVLLLRSRGPQDAQALANAFAHALGCRPDGEPAPTPFGGRSLEDVLAEAVPGYVAPGAGRELLAEADARTVDLMLAPLIHLIGSGSLPAVTWPHGSFYFGDQPGQAVSGPADLTGSARIVFYGPYFHLPAGSYTGEVILGFSAECAGVPLTIEIVSDRELGRGRIRPLAAGVFAATVSFAVSAPENGIEVRISTDRGAIEGRLTLHRLVIRENSVAAVGQEAGAEINAITPPS